MSNMTTYISRIAQIHAELGIPADYAATRGLDLQEETSDLAVVETDPTGKKHRLTPAAMDAWMQMKQAAEAQRIILLVGSGFRGVDYQMELINAKLARGQPIADILKTLAAPGYSEHHTGCAVDIMTPGSVPFSTAFAQTPSFVWLEQEAAQFGFKLSFPENNSYGFIYEPWHWRFHG